MTDAEGDARQDDAPEFADASIPFAALSRRNVHRFAFEPERDALEQLAAETGVPKLAKLRFRGTISAVGREDWELAGRLGATLIQECVVSLEKVATRLDIRVRRRFAADRTVLEPGPDGKMPEDDAVEPLRRHIDIHAIAREVIVLEKPDYPRADRAILDGEFASAANDAERPFAALARLRDEMADGGRAESGK